MSEGMYFPPVKPSEDAMGLSDPRDAEIRGLLGERMNAVRENRLHRIIDHPLILGGFEKKDIPFPWRPRVTFEDASWEGSISFAWQGEHVGKWLHAAVLLGLNAGDERLIDRVRRVCDSLARWQDPDGYLGTYDRASRMTAPWGPHTAVSWDVWTHRYHLFGLLTAHRHLCGDYPGARSWLDAAVKIGDLLIATFGPGGRNITFEGTRRGISALTVLESVMMLHRATGEKRFLDFARHLVYVSSETRTRVLSRLLDREPLSRVGYGKAYQLMAVFLGMLELYRAAGDRELLQAVLNGWEQIMDGRVHVTGGPWSKKTDVISNQECFTDPSHWSPFELVENCSTVTWLQLNLSLVRLTGRPDFAEEAERTLYNHLMGAASLDASGGTYFSAPNETERTHGGKLHCCNSSGPRALAAMTEQMHGIRDGAIAVGFYAPGGLSGTLPDGMSGAIPGGRRFELEVDTAYPYGGEVTLRWKTDAPTALHLRIPGWTVNPRITVNGKPRDLHPEPGSWAKIEEVWRKGDEITLHLPVYTRTVERDYRGRRIRAFLRGPIVLAARGLRPESERGLPRTPGPVCPEPDGDGTEPRYRLPLIGGPRDAESPGGGAAAPGGTPGAEARLMPYWRAGGENGAVATWFEI